MGTGAAAYPAAPGVKHRVWNKPAAVPLPGPPSKKDLLDSSASRPSALGLIQARGGNWGSPSRGNKMRAGGTQGHRPPPPCASRRPRDPPTSVQAQREGQRPAGAGPRAQLVRPGRLPSPPGPRRSGPQPPPPPFPARQEAAAAAPGAARAGPSSSRSAHLLDGGRCDLALAPLPRGRERHRHVWRVPGGSASAPAPARSRARPADPAVVAIREERGARGGGGARPVGRPIPIPPEEGVKEDRRLLSAFPPGEGAPR